jgi:hypothetical protein
MYAINMLLDDMECSMNLLKFQKMASTSLRQLPWVI